jgi:hypothetical protein
MPILICEPLDMLLRSELTLSHDLSWGTKGSDTVQAVDLGAIQGVGRHVQVELVSAQQDIDIAYQDALDNIRLKRGRVDADELPPKRDATEQEQKDTYVSVAIFILNQAYSPGEFPYKCELTTYLLEVVLMSSYFCSGLFLTQCWRASFSQVVARQKPSAKVDRATEQQFICW